MTSVGIIWSIIIGIIAGAIAGLIMKGRGYGFIINLIVGLAGSVIGGWIYGLLGFDVDNTLGVLGMSVLGAMVLLFLLSLFKRPKK